MSLWSSSSLSSQSLQLICSYFLVLQFPTSAVSKAFNYYSSCMNVSHIEESRQVPIRKLVEAYDSSPMLDENWTDTNWNLERTLGRVVGNLGIGVFVQLDVSPSLFNTSHRSLVVSITGLVLRFLGTHSLTRSSFNRVGWINCLSLKITKGKMF